YETQRAPRPRPWGCVRLSLDWTGSCDTRRRQADHEWDQQDPGDDAQMLQRALPALRARDEAASRRSQVMGGIDQFLVDPGDQGDCAAADTRDGLDHRSEEHTSELQSRFDLVCRLLLEKKK